MKTNYRVTRGDRNVHIDIGAGRFKIDIVTFVNFADGTNGITVEVTPSQGVQVVTEVDKGGIHSEAVLVRIKNV